MNLVGRSSCALHEQWSERIRNQKAPSRNVVMKLFNKQFSLPTAGPNPFGLDS
jgi:hypothetical protein